MTLQTFCPWDDLCLWPDSTLSNGLGPTLRLLLRKTGCTERLTHWYSADGEDASQRLVLKHVVSFWYGLRG